MRLPHAQRRVAIATGDIAGHRGHQQVVARFQAGLLHCEQRGCVLGHARRIALRDGAKQREPACLERMQR